MTNRNKKQAKFKSGKKPAQNQLLINHLLQGKQINKKGFIVLTQNPFASISARVYDLRKYGYPIKDENIRLADGTHYTNFYLPTWFLTSVANDGLDIALRSAGEIQQINKKQGANV